jgi:hypothetical protein
VILREPGLKQYVVFGEVLYLSIKFKILSKYPNLVVTITGFTSSQAVDYKSENIKITARLVLVGLQA